MQKSSDENIVDIPTNSEKKYKLIGFLIILFALLIRLYDLGYRVFHHDESVHASFTLKLLNTGQYTYNPAYHGPFLFYSTAVVFHFLGINAVSYTHLRAHETVLDLVCRLLLE